MTNTRGAAAVLALLIAAAALGCGGSEDLPTPPLDPPGGTGTGTLLVLADIFGEDEGTGYKTSFSADIQDSLGLPVSGATVTMRGAPGTITMAEVVGSPGTYQAGISGYQGGNYHLTVTRGNDAVRDVRVLAPDRHVVTEPDPGDTVAALQPMTVRWSRQFPAEAVRIETKNYSFGNEADDQVATVPGTSNPPRDDQTVRVLRANETTITGGLPGSRLRAEVRASSSPVIVQ